MMPLEQRRRPAIRPERQFMYGSSCHGSRASNLRLDTGSTVRASPEPQSLQRPCWVQCVGSSTHPTFGGNSRSNPIEVSPIPDITDGSTSPPQRGQVESSAFASTEIE